MFPGRRSPPSVRDRRAGLLEWKIQIEIHFSSVIAYVFFTTYLDYIWTNRQYFNHTVFCDAEHGIFKSRIRVELKLPRNNTLFFAALEFKDTLSLHCFHFFILPDVSLTHSSSSNKRNVSHFSQIIPPCCKEDNRSVS